MREQGENRRLRVRVVTLAQLGMIDTFLLIDHQERRIFHSFRVHLDEACTALPLIVRRR